MDCKWKKSVPRREIDTRCTVSTTWSTVRVLGIPIRIFVFVWRGWFWFLIIRISVILLAALRSRWFFRLNTKGCTSSYQSEEEELMPARKAWKWLTIFPIPVCKGKAVYVRQLPQCSLYQRNTSCWRRPPCSLSVPLPSLIRCVM